MMGKIKDFLLTTVTVIIALFLTFFYQSKLPILDFLTVGNSLIAWGYFLSFYVVFFYIVSKVIFFIKSKRGRSAL